MIVWIMKQEVDDSVHSTQTVDDREICAAYTGVQSLCAITLTLEKGTLGRWWGVGEQETEWRQAL